MWIFLLYSKCKLAFILRALEGIISHFTREIVSTPLPISDANKTQPPICQNICIALKWWKLERLSVTWCYPAQMSCHDWQSPSKEERWRGTGIIRNAGRCYHQEIPKCDSNKVTATRPQATKNCMANSDKSIHSIELFWFCDPNSLITQFFVNLCPCSSWTTRHTVIAVFYNKFIVIIIIQANAFGQINKYSSNTPHFI